MVEYHSSDIPGPDPRALDIAVLDMNHGWENLGLPSILRVLRIASDEVLGEIGETRTRVRAIRYDVRVKGEVPDPARFDLIVGTGGPGNPDPRGNDGVSEGSLGIVEDPAWEAPLFRYFDGVAARPDASLIGICHTYGLLCRWSGAGVPRLRSETKGGRSRGVVESELTDEAVDHPYFRPFASTLPARRLRAFDNRLFDLVPEGPLPAGVVPVGYEVIAGTRGEALTMAQFAAHPDGTPRILGVNFHPEIVDCRTQLRILEEKLERKELTRAAYEEKLGIIGPYAEDDALQEALRATAEYTLIRPLRRRLADLLS